MTRVTRDLTERSKVQTSKSLAD